jgi:integrase
MSVRKREWITRKGERREKWILDYAVNGSRHIETFERKKDADAREAEVTVNIGKGVHIAPSRTPTVREAGELWLGSCTHIERATAVTYRQHLHLHIYPYLAQHRLAHLTPPVIRQFEDDLRSGKKAPYPPAETPHERFRQKRSSAMSKKVITTLGNMLADMQERGLVAMNAVHSLKKGRGRGKEQQAERRQRGKLKIGVDIPSPKEITAIIAHLSDRWHPIIMTAIFTGLRASELRGLRWKSVDLKNAKLHVTERADRFLQLGQPKSVAGERTVPMPAPLVDVLRQHQLKTKFGAKDDFVFATDEGHAQHYANILHRGLEPAQIAAKVLDDKGKPKYSLHHLRHFFCSWCMNREKDGGLGLPLKMVQERMGHSSIAVTANVYGHLFPSDDDGAELKKAAQRLMPV